MDGEESVVYNFGSQTGYSVRESISIARKVTSHHVLAKEVGRRPGDPARLVASYAKIGAELGWVPRFEGPEKFIANA